MQVTIDTGAQTKAKLGINYKYYSNNDKLIKRLTLLRGAIEVGNNSIEAKMNLYQFLMFYYKVKLLILRNIKSFSINSVIKL